jgi:hypothetical protein
LINVGPPMVFYDRAQVSSLHRHIDSTSTYVRHHEVRCRHVRARPEVRVARARPDLRVRRERVAPGGADVERERLQRRVLRVRDREQPGGVVDRGAGGGDVGCVRVGRQVDERRALGNTRVRSGGQAAARIHEPCRRCRQRGS